MVLKEYFMFKRYVIDKKFINYITIKMSRHNGNPNDEVFVDKYA